MQEVNQREVIIKTKIAKVRKLLLIVRNIAILLDHDLSVLTLAGYDAFIHRKMPFN